MSTFLLENFLVRAGDRCAAAVATTRTGYKNRDMKKSVGQESSRKKYFKILASFQSEKQNDGLPARKNIA